MDDEILVSVIMPVYNAKKWLDRSIASLLNQTIRNTEIIIINDGSVDGSEYVLEKWQAADRCIRYVNRENKGVSATRNEGIRLARGKYICFADADDYVESDMLRQMTSTLERTGAPCAICNYYEEDENESRKQVLLPWTNNQVLDRQMIADELIPFMIKVLDGDKKKYPLMTNNIMGTVWRICASRQFLIDNRIYFDENMTIAEDFNFCINLFQKANLVATVDSCLYHYIRWNSTTMAVYRQDQFNVGIKNQYILMNQLKEWGMYERLKERFFGSYIDEVLSAPFNFTRPGAPGFFKSIHLLRKITKSLDDDAVLKKACINLTFNQRAAMFLIKHHMAFTLYILTVLRSSKNGQN